MFEHLATTEESKCYLYAADLSTPLGVKDKEGNFHHAFVNVRSRTSDAIRQHDLAVRRRLANQARKNNGKPAEYDPEAEYRNGVARLEAIICGWDNLPDGKGGKLPYNEKTKHELASLPALDYIHKQIFSHHASDENFMQTRDDS